MNRWLPLVLLSVPAFACGARTNPGGGGADASLTVDAGADVKDARTDVEPPHCCASTVLNENETPMVNCFQGASYIAFAVTPTTCDVPLGRIEIHTNALTLGLVGSTDAGPGAIIIPPTFPDVPEPGWTGISASGVTLLEGQKYYVIIGNDHQSPGVGCDYADVGDDVEYWGGELGNFDNGPYYAPYVARFLAPCK